MRAFKQAVAGTEIDVISDGVGPRLTILHRDTGRAGWTDLHARLAKRFHVVAPSLPGYDASGRPDWLRNVTDLAALIGMLDDTLEGEPSAWLGLGFGGWVVAELAAHSPGRVKKLILHSPMGIRPPEGEIFDQFLIEAEDYARLGFSAAAHQPGDAAHGVDDRRVVERSGLRPR